MAAIGNALVESGVAQRDIQTSRFSVQPAYAPQEPRAEPKFVGYSVSNQVRVKIRQVDKVGEILDRLATAGATDIGNVEFLVSELSKEVVASVQVGDHIGKRHHFTSITSISAARARQDCRSGQLARGAIRRAVEASKHNQRAMSKPTVTLTRNLSSPAAIGTVVAAIAADAPLCPMSRKTRIRCPLP